MAIKSSKDAKFQLHVWDRLLEGRIALQKVVVASRVVVNPDEETIKPISKLLASLVKLRDTYRLQSQFNLNETIDPDTYTNITDSLLDQKHEDYEELRDSTIEKWCEKTKIGVIPKKGYTALELPTLQLIKNTLKDKTRLKIPIKDGVFNDDEFYYRLLKEMVSKDESRKWVELQRLKYKMKRKADTKATKGRKIKKDLIPKLINFMAPIKKSDLEDKKRDELMKFLFGGRNL